MRSVILRGALVLSVLGLGAMGCQRQEGEESQDYEAQGGGHERVNLPEQTRGSQDEGARMNVETGKQGGQEEAPGRQQENRYQAGSGQGTATQGGAQESGSQGAGAQGEQRR